VSKKEIRIGITGAFGFIGFHLRCYLLGRPDVVVHTINREELLDSIQLDAWLKEIDVIVHLAGLNRAPDAELRQGNESLARLLADALTRTQRQPHVIFSSSTHIERDSAYGDAKRTSAAVFRSWAEITGGTFSNLIIPNVFGEYSRPFYNTVVATYCHQLARGEPLKIDQGEVELIHVHQVCAAICKRVDDRLGGEKRLEGQHISVASLAARLTEFSDTYSCQIIPNLADELDVYLFNTMRAFRFPEQYPQALKLHTDNRGTLFEAIKTLHGGQCFVSTTNPGVTRGNHFHYRKLERFCVIKGEAVVRLRKLFTNQVHEFSVRGEEPVYIDIPTLYTHNISNTGSGQLVTLFWAHEIFDPADPDTVSELV